MENQEGIAVENGKNQCNIIFIGNPGSGKSTLLNALLQHYDPEKQIGRFKSGVSIGVGLTKINETMTVLDKTFVDTPGLSDIRFRKQAAEMIYNALKLGGRCQIFFVVTLESGRVRPDDATTIKLVLDACPDITYYGVIFNKISSKLMASFQTDFENNIKKLLIEMRPLDDHTKDETLSYPLMLPNISELEDEADIFVDIPALTMFHDKILPFTNVNPENVCKIQDNLFDIIKQKMETEIAALNEDKEKTQRKMEDLQKRIDKEEAKGDGPNFFQLITSVFESVLLPFLQNLGGGRKK